MSNRDTGDVTGTDPDVSLTTAEAARVAGVSPRTVRRWIERGVLPAVVGAGGVLYVFRRDLDVARTATHARPGQRDTGDTGDVRDTSHELGDRRDVRDSPGLADVSRLSPDPGGGAAGAVLVAWRDTVLAPVVEQLAVVTQDLARAREDVGRLGAERDGAARERDRVQEQLDADRSLADQLVNVLQAERDAALAEVARLRTAQDAPTTPAMDTVSGIGQQGPRSPWWRLWGRR